MEILPLPANPYHFHATQKAISGQESIRCEVVLTFRDRHDKDLIEIVGQNLFVEGRPVETNASCIRCLLSKESIYQYFEIHLDNSKLVITQLLLKHSEDESVTTFS